jgi:hypothetical protein
MSRKIGAINTVVAVQSVGTVDHRQNFHQGIFYSEVASSVCGSFPARNMSSPSSVMMYTRLISAP